MRRLKLLLLSLALSTALAAATDFYGQLRYDTRLRSYGLVRLTDAAPGDYAFVRDYGTVAGQTPILTAATYVGDQLYAWQTTLYANTLMPDGIVRVDTTTGEYTLVAKAPEAATPLILDEMTYDPKTGRLFAMHYDTDEGTTDLYEISTDTFLPTRLLTIEKAFYTLTADDGLLYALTEENGSTLYTISQGQVSDAAVVPTLQLVGEPGIAMGQYSQSMEMDKTTHRLWWMAQAADEEAYLVELDPQTARVLSKTRVSGSPQVLGLSVPYQFAADGAPAAVSAFGVEAGAQGQLLARLSFTTPTLDYRGRTLEQLTGVRIYRNGQLLTTLAETATGRQLSYTDQPAEEGLYIYNVVPYNQEGDGIGSAGTVFVGEDTPGAPQNITLKATGAQATLSWEAPSEGQHGGYFQSSSLRYEVVRQPDGKLIASNLTSTSITDEATVHQGYSYSITALNDKGRGASATSATLAFGPVGNVPFTSPLTTLADFQRWTTLDANGDGNTWTFNPNTLTTTYDRNEQQADDWLVSPALTLDHTKQYQLRYTYSTANWVSPDTYEPVMEHMKVWLGSDASKQSFTTLIQDLDDFHTASYTYLYGKDLFQPAADGTAHIAFQACSEADRGQIYIKDVSLREYSTSDLSVRGMTGSSLVNAGIAQTYTVSVGNEGSREVSDYTVQLLDTLTGQVLGESRGLAVGTDKTVDVPVSWTPQAEGELKVVARVVLSGDTYPADNLLAEPLTVKVSPKDADRWITLNQASTYGWRMPFWLYDPYSTVESIFYAKELQQTGISITALRFVYDSHEPAPLSFPARISIKPTDLETLKPFGSSAQLESEGFTTVFDGDITLSAAADAQELTVQLQTPYRYEGGNLNFRFETLMGSASYTRSQHPDWHFAEPDDAARSAYYSGSSSVPVAEEVYASDYTPYMSISYSADPTAIQTVQSSDPVSLRLTQGQLVLSRTADAVSLLSPTGRLLRQAHHASRLDISQLPAGIYLVSIQSGKARQTVKICLAADGSTQKH